MKQPTTLRQLIFLILLEIISIFPLMAQPRLDTTPTSLTLLEKTVQQQDETLSKHEEEIKDTQKELKELYMYLLKGAGTIILVILTYQGFRNYRQDSIEREREAKDAKRQLYLDNSEREGTKRVANIMGVIDQTLRSRLTAEKEERKKRENSDIKLQNILNQFEELKRHYEGMEATRQKKRQNLDEKASNWAATTGRHDFRGMANELEKFADKFDEFIGDSVDPEKEVRTFTARAPYIRGIAAHYSSQPEVAKKYLMQTVAYQQHETDEPEIAFKKRVANAYYYLGLTASNFGNDDEAMDYFEKASALDPQNQDFLNKVVFAEANIMVGNYEKARKYLTEVEEGVDEIEHREGVLATYYLRLKNRATLIKANIEVLTNKGKWGEKVKQLLEPVRKADPKYYYATATLAQAYSVSEDYPKACELFREAYEAIITSNDLNTVKELRSRILLLMFAGMCSKHGLSDGIGQRASNDYLDEANKLCGNLPMIDSQVCTVFSPFSKRNEDNITIFHHISLIRKGEMCLT